MTKVKFTIVFLPRFTTLAGGDHFTPVFDAERPQPEDDPPGAPSAEQEPLVGVLSPGARSESAETDVDPGAVPRLASVGEIAGSHPTQSRAMTEVER